MALFSRDGAFDGQRYSLVVPCFLIMHPSGMLLWDTGYDEAMAVLPDGVSGGGFHSRVDVRLSDQLAQLGLSPGDIDYVALSHHHPDHAGNAGLFLQSTLILSAAEHGYMFSSEARASTQMYETYAGLKNANLALFDGARDVFGDGTVIIKSAPGHTPGSTVLLLKLENAGSLLFTGDLYTHEAGRRAQAIPDFTMDADALRQSIIEFEELAAAENARVVIQHEPADFAALPAFPDYLD